VFDEATRCQSIAADGFSACAGWPAQDKPVREMRPESDEQIAIALQSDPVARRIMAKNQRPLHDQLVGVRLNINVMSRTGVAVHSIHRATSRDGHIKGCGFFRGEVVNYLAVVVMRDAYFSVHQRSREAIASGRMSKHPMASIDGNYVAGTGDVDLDGEEISFNPKRVHLFVNSQNFAIRYAEHVTVMGHRAFARGRIIYYDPATAPLRAGDAPSQVRLRARCEMSDV